MAFPKESLRRRAMMSWSELLPLLVVASSLVSGGLIVLLDEKQKTARTILNLGGAVLKVVLVGFLLRGVARGSVYEFHFPLTDDLEFALHASPLSLFFVTLSAGLWLLTTIYAIGYFEDSPNLDRFFAFFSFCVCATTGIALAANMLTFVIFYEILTLTTYPLVVHSGTPAAMRGGRIYLIYTIVGGAVVMLAAVRLQSIVGTYEFTQRGIMADVSPDRYGELRWIFALLMIGFGVKAALVPLHGWLPNAMVAPAPVSALLHAVAVVKAGAFGIVRVVYDVYGVEFCRQIAVTTPLAVAASVTIVYGSVRAVYQDNLKRRLAFSTISQVSYIVLGTAVVGPLATTGGIVHLVHQGLMKITLFFAAGNLARALGVGGFHCRGVGDDRDAADGRFHFQVVSGTRRLGDRARMGCRRLGRQHDPECHLFLADRLRRVVQTRDGSLGETKADRCAGGASGNAMEFAGAASRDRFIDGADRVVR